LDYVFGATLRKVLGVFHTANNSGDDGQIGVLVLGIEQCVTIFISKLV